MGMPRQVRGMFAMPVGAPMPGPGGVLKTRLFASFLSALTLLMGCLWKQPADAPLPLSRRLTWCGRPAGAIQDSVPSDTADPGACVRVEHLEFPGSPKPFRMELRRYRDPIRAFIAWEGMAKQLRPQDGCMKIDSRWIFIHADYVGLADTSAGE